MIVLPVEKRFDWRNPPFALLALVFLNVAVFLFYQSGDGEREMMALAAYEEQGFFAEEWPRYQEYLAVTGEGDALAAVRADYEDYGPAAVSYRMLLDEDFVDDLERVWDFRLVEVLGADWKRRRTELRELLGSVSSVRFGLTPADMAPVTLVTSLFLHGDLSHLFGNMFFLVLCGFTVEAAIGHGRFLAFYLVSGVLAGAGHAVFDLDSTVPLIGASGAVSGVMAMYLALFRLKRIEFFYWIFVFVGYVRLPALTVLPAWIAKEVWFFVSEPDASVAFMAHAAGFTAGAVLIGLQLVFGREVVDESYIEEDQDRDPEREALADVYDAIAAYRFEAALAKVDAMVAEFGDSARLALLRHQLVRVCAPAEVPAASAALLAHTDVTPAALRAQQQLLASAPEVVASLDDDTLLRLGTQFCRIEDLASAELVVGQLARRELKDPGLVALAGKLANLFTRHKDGARAKRYAAVAEAAS
ncbi:MAG TPA: rhomboid family intramembrane serine protease [Pseudomonadales bacterium]|nr:rhomboid family intramembrane serine protease [Pseudomonadales bacterium]